MPGDVYQEVELNYGKQSRFVTTAHVAQIKAETNFDADDDDDGDQPVGEPSEEDNIGGSRYQASGGT